MRLFTIFLFTFLLFRAEAQVMLERQVIGSCAINGNGSILLSSTAGEPVVFTGLGTTLDLTQGFEQPSHKGKATVEYSVSQDLCTGEYTVEIISSGSCLPDDPVIWWNGSPGNSTFTTLDTQVDVDLFGWPGCHYEKTIDMTSQDVEEIPCSETIYQLITPNDDGANDTWILEPLNRPEYASNHVSVFNRWGLEIWSADNYDNHNTVWIGRSKGGEELPDGTYFYTVEAADRVFSGFVELQR